MASELEDLGRRLSLGGYPEAGKLVTSVARSLHGSKLIPTRLPSRSGDDDPLSAFQNRKVLLNVDRLRELRLQRLVSQRGLALAAKLSPSYISNIETRAPAFRVRWSTVIALAKVLEIAPDELVVSNDSFP